MDDDGIWKILTEQVINVQDNSFLSPLYKLNL